MERDSKHLPILRARKEGNKDPYHPVLTEVFISKCISSYISLLVLNLPILYYILLCFLLSNLKILFFHLEHLLYNKLLKHFGGKLAYSCFVLWMMPRTHTYYRLDTCNKCMLVASWVFEWLNSKPPTDFSVYF